MKTDVELTIEEAEKAIQVYIQQRVLEFLRKPHSKEELKRLKKLETNTDEW